MRMSFPLFKWLRYLWKEKDLLELPTDDFAGDLRNRFQLQPPPDIFYVIWKPGQDPDDLIRTSDPETQIDGDSVVRFALQRDTGKVRSSDQEVRCEACTRPIISECYKREDSNYFLDVTCASAIRPSAWPDDIPWRCTFDSSLSLRVPPSTWGFFKCDACNLDCNGYSFHSCTSSSSRLDINCAMLPRAIAHAAHKHPLRNSHSLYPIRDYDTCKGCGGSACNRYYNFYCPGCKFYLGYQCALLPKTVKHRWDKHPLILSFPPYPDQPDKFYCEVCEEEIHPWRWQYRCRECDRSFHPRCIPQVSSSRNIRFGITVDVSQHPHTLELVREGEYRSACHSCGASLYGLRAFKCTATCKFYLCHDCVCVAKRSADDTITH